MMEESVSRTKKKEDCIFSYDPRVCLDWHHKTLMVQNIFLKVFEKCCTPTFWNDILLFFIWVMQIKKRGLSFIKGIVTRFLRVSPTRGWDIEKKKKTWYQTSTLVDNVKSLLNFEKKTNQSFSLEKKIEMKITSGTNKKNSKSYHWFWKKKIIIKK